MRKLIASALILFQTFPAYAIKVNGQLEGARLEILNSDPTGTRARIIYNNTEGTPKIYDGANWVKLDPPPPSATRNHVANPSGVKGYASWTKVGLGDFWNDVTAAHGIGGTGRSLRYKPDGAGTVTSSAMTIDNEVAPKTCEASLSYKTTAVDAYSFKLMNGSTELYSIPLPATGTVYSTRGFNYPCGDGYSLRIAATGNVAQISFGKVFWGEATNIGSINNITEWTSYTPTLLNGGTTTANAGKWRQVGNVMHVMTRATFTGAGAAAEFKVSLPPNYAIDTNSLPSYAIARHTVGQAFWYDAGGGLKQLAVHVDATLNAVMFSENGGAVFFTGSSLANGDSVDVEFSVPIVGWTAQNVIKPEQTFDRTGEIMAYAGACPSNTVSAMNKTIGLSGTDYAGAAYYRLYEKLWRSGMATTAPNGGINISSATGASAAADWAAGKTMRINLTDMFLRGIAGARNPGEYQADELKSHSHALDTNLYRSDAEVANYGLQSGGGFAGRPIIVGSWQGINISSTGGTETRPKNVGVNYCMNYTGVQAAPILVGSVTSNTSGMERVERVVFGGAASGGVPTSVCSSSPCVVASQSGSWVTSVTRSGTGAYVINVAAGIFSATPVCTFNSGWYMVISAGQAGPSGAMSSSVVGVQALNATGTAVDSVVSVICMGPR